MKVIGLAGDRGSGKNTFARMCIEELEARGHAAVEMSWAGLLKKSAARSLGLDFGEKFGPYNDWADGVKEHGYLTLDILTEDGDVVERHEISGREFLQYYGTEGHRQVFDDNFWVNAFWEHNKIGEWANDSSYFIFICDTRFDNEAESVKEHGGMIVKIMNDRIDNGDSHASELGLPGEVIDLVVDNHGSLETLRESAKTFVDDLLTQE